MSQSSPGEMFLIQAGCIPSSWSALDGIIDRIGLCTDGQSVTGGARQGFPFLFCN